MPPRKAPSRNQSRTTRRQAPHAATRRQSGNHGRSKGGSKSLIIGGGIVALAIIAALILWLSGVFSSNYRFERSHLDAYLPTESDTATLNSGAGVYVDFSNGMNYAYDTEGSRQALQNVINKLTGPDMQKLVKYFSLADGKIEPLNMSGTEIYNRILTPGSYSQEQAPIEQTLERILQNNQAALLISDFEEYNGQYIVKSGYGKDYFIKWLLRGNNITFYKFDYEEKGKSKHLYFSVFDCPNGGLTAMVDAAMMPLMVQDEAERYVLASPSASYGMRRVESEKAYMSANKGGNYHDSKGVDKVTAVSENGGQTDYKPYYQHVGEANARDSRNNYASLENYSGEAAEFYPIGVKSWKDVLTAAKSLSDPNVKEEDRYLHFLTGLAVNFDTQDGFEIEQVEARCFNFQEVMKEFVAVSKNDSLKGDEARKAIAGLPKAKEVEDMFTAEIVPVQLHNEGDGWYMMNVDFSEKFTGDFGQTGTTDLDLLRLNIVIAKATPRLDGIGDFFGWDDNESLAISIQNTLTDPRINPEGNVLMSYFLKIVG